VLPCRWGWSPGFLAADIRVVHAGDGYPPGLARALLRTLLWIVDGLPGIPIVAYVSARRTRLHQRVGDIAANTVVIEKNAVAGGSAQQEEPEIEVHLPEAEPEPEPEVIVLEEPEGEPVVTIGPPPGVPVDTPIWDRRHRRYVLWHSKRQCWMEHADDGWRPVEGDRGEPARSG
jgi:hypothetical protein